MDQVVAAYRNRAQVARKLGRDDLAKADDQMVDRLTPFMNIFGGFFHWW